MFFINLWISMMIERLRVDGVAVFDLYMINCSDHDVGITYNQKMKKPVMGVLLSKAL